MQNGARERVTTSRRVAARRLHGLDGVACFATGDRDRHLRERTLLSERKRPNALCRALKARLLVFGDGIILASYAALSSLSLAYTSEAPGVNSPNCSPYRRTAASPSARTASTMASAMERAFLSTGLRRTLGISLGVSLLRRDIASSLGLQGRSAVRELASEEDRHRPRLRKGQLRTTQGGY